MIMLWILLGLVVVAVIWAIAAASARPKADRVITPDVNPEYKPPREASFDQWAKDAYTKDWKDAPIAQVSKNFGKGGIPTGISRDAGGFATASRSDEDEDLAMLKKAQAFNPRGIPSD